MRSSYPNDNCTIGNYYYRYDTYTGTSDYSQVGASGIDQPPLALVADYATRRQCAVSSFLADWEPAMPDFHMP